MRELGQLVRRDAPSVAVVGTADVLPAVARVVGACLVSGCLRWTYSGDTDVEWNSQSARRQGSWRLFVDENGQLVSEADVVLQLEDGTLHGPVLPGEEDE